jgi:starvation-inducible DNA-binding protein
MNGEKLIVNNKTSKRVFAKLGYSAIETLELTNALNKLLASYSVHFQKLRNFHWNVKGGDFFDIHEKFEAQYNAAIVTIDDIAERIRIFGQTPLSRMSDYLESSIILEVDTNLTSKEMVEETLKDYRILLEQMFDVVDAAIENGDSGTEDMIKSMIKQLEKNHWMLTAFSQ